ncbi:unnamed protein product, partial [Vitis vinifera]
MMDLSKKESLSEEMNEIKKCCTDCKTTKTPLWRGGPAGPKSLCNACGIRYRKRRSSMVGVNKKKERMNSETEEEVGGRRTSSCTVDGTLMWLCFCLVEKGQKGGEWLKP